LSANNLLSVATNPVKKIPLVVDGYDSEVLIDQVVCGEDDDKDNQVFSEWGYDARRFIYLHHR